MNIKGVKGEVQSLHNTDTLREVEHTYDVEKENTVCLQNSQLITYCLKLFLLSCKNIWKLSKVRALHNWAMPWKVQSTYGVR